MLFSTYFTYKQWVYRYKPEILCLMSYMLRTFAISSSPGRSYPHRFNFQGWGRRHKSSIKRVGGTISQLHRKKFSFYCHCMLYISSPEFESNLSVYWNGFGAAVLSCTDLSIREFPFLRGVCRQGIIVLYMIVCERDAPKGHSVTLAGCFRRTLLSSARSME